MLGLTLSAIELDMKMMFRSNLILLLLVNLAFASLSDNVPEEETNRVRRRGPSSGGGGALEKRTQFMEECGGDLACVRGKMREWRRGRKAGDSSGLNRASEEETGRRIRRKPSSSGEALQKRTQFMEECGGDLACVRGKMRKWRRARKSGGEESLDRLQCNGDQPCV